MEFGNFSWVEDKTWWDNPCVHGPIAVSERGQNAMQCVKCENPEVSSVTNKYFKTILQMMLK